MFLSNPGKDGSAELHAHVKIAALEKSKHEDILVIVLIAIINMKYYDEALQNHNHSYVLLLIRLPFSLKRDVFVTKIK